MKGDFTSLNFWKEKHYSSVRRQQGRVDLDADWNEQADIDAYLRETETRDLIGPSGVPKHDAGFSIVDPTALSAAEQSALLPLASGDFLLGSGRAYVDGILCENEAIVSFAKQPDLLPDPLTTSHRYCLYLDVWQRHITALDDPEIREVALGGPDTATRTKTVWQVRALDVGAAGAAVTCSSDLPAWDAAIAPSTMMLSARAAQELPSDKPCILPPGAGYTRLENQLYRVEIHNGGDLGGSSAAPTFKWSRDNGAIVALIDSMTLASTVTLTFARFDAASGFVEGQWIELLDDRNDWNGTPGILVPITSVDDLILTLDMTQAIEPQTGALNQFVNGLNKQLHPKARRWDSVGVTAATIPATNDGFLPLEDGVEVKFENGTCATGDFWVIPARTNLGDVRWPQDSATPSNPLPQPPKGIIHHFCKLAMVDVDGAGKVTFVADCRRLFPPLTELEDCCGCCTKTVGPTDAADYQSIKKAIDSLPVEGGQICVLDGTYPESVKISGRQNITIIGCGERSVLTAGLSGKGIELGPIIQIEQSNNIRLESLFFNQALNSAVVVLGSSRVTVSKCEIAMTNPAGSEPAIFFQCVEGLIDHNIVTGLADVLASDKAMAGTSAAPAQGVSSGAASGIQLAGGCRRVRVLENSIVSVRGQGVTVGHLEQAKPNAPTGVIFRGWFNNPEDPCAACKGPGTKVFPPPVGTPPLVSPESLWEIIIEKNRIFSAGLDGIGVIGFFDLSSTDEFVSVRGLRILGNEIVDCLQIPPAAIESAMVDSMGYGGIALADVSNLVIYDNVIERNGSRHTQPVCGVFVLHGEGIDLQRNRIVGNGLKATSPMVPPSGVTGPDTGVANNTSATGKIAAGQSLISNLGTAAAPASAPSPGRQGAIEIVFAVSPVTAMPALPASVPIEFKSAPRIGVPTGFPALKVHDNIVSSPAGPALSAVALGPVSIVGNQLTSNGLSVSASEKPPSVFTPATVFLLNLGLSNEWYLQDLLFASIANKTPNPSPGLDDLRLGSRLGDGNILFSNNQCSLRLLDAQASSVSSSLVLMSLDDIGFLDNQCDCDLALRGDHLTVDALILAFSTRVTSNRFQEGALSAVYSAMTTAILNTTAFNQATHCLDVQGWPALTHNGPNTILLSAQCQPKFQATLLAFAGTKNLQT